MARASQLLVALAAWVLSVALSGVAVAYPGGTPYYQTDVSPYCAGCHSSISEDALAREIAVYADRCDVSEEIARMRSHVSQFDDLLKGDGGPVGRKMEFLGQEMLREASTMAAKIPAGNQVSHVLELKNEIEKLREQVRNVE